MAKSTAIALGSRWEKIALDHLSANGLTLIERNYRCRMGEIDLVMRQSNLLVFVEVRYRKKSRFATAAESVDRHKQRKLAQAAAAFLGQNPRYREHVTRFDVVAFDATSNDQCTLQWLRDAFRPEA
jgi:putative endonuclease